MIILILLLYFTIYRDSSSGSGSVLCVRAYIVILFSQHLSDLSDKLIGFQRPFQATDLKKQSAKRKRKFRRQERTSATFFKPIPNHIHARSLQNIGSQLYIFMSLG